MRIAPDGNMRTELKYLISVAMEWHSKMSRSKLSQHDATFSLRQVILQKLTYPLLATTFSPVDANSIMAPILRQGLPRAGIVRTYPRPLVYGPNRYAGLDIPNLHTEQTILHIVQVLAIPDPTDVTAFLLRSCSELMRLELGWAGELFAAPICLEAMVTPSWLKHVWLTVQSLDISIHTGSGCPPPRQGDIEIMRLFLQHSIRDADTLLSLNRCCMHLHAFWVSDLCTGTGDALISGAETSRAPCPSPWNWPKTLPPSASDWQKWRLALSQALHLSRSNHLAIPLGPWLQQPTHPGWYFESSSDRLWHLDQSKWTFHTPVPQRTRRRIYHTRGQRAIAPDVSLLRRASVLATPGNLTLTGHGPIRPPSPMQPGPQSFSSLRFVSDWAVNYHIIGSWKDLFNDILTGRGYAISDGSFKQNQGSAAWIIEGSGSTNRVLGECFTPGTDDDHSSFRSELAGIYTCLLFLHLCFPHNNTEKPEFYLACDGKSVLHRLWNKRKTSAAEPHYDLLSGTRHLLLDCGFKVILAHVKGHQDQGIPTVLTRDAMLNIEADTLAKDKLTRYAPGPSTYVIPFSYGACYVSGRRVVKNIQATLRQHINGLPASKYWQHRRSLTPAIWAKIDWPSYQRAMLEIPLHRRRWVSKFVSGHFAHGKNMQRWRFRSASNCPRCQHPLEDKPHIIRCPAEAAVNIWQSFLKNLRSWLREQRTSPTLTDTILQCLISWYQEENPQETSATSRYLFDDFHAIGADRLIEGWLPLAWRLEQENYWSHIRTRKSSKRWTSELIKKLWDVVWDLWDQRNEALHQDTSNRDILDSQANDQIRYIYQHGGNTLPRNTLHLIRAPLDAQLQQPLATKLLWLQSAQAAQDRKQRHEHGAMTGEQRIMRSFLGLE